MTDMDKIQKDNAEPGKAPDKMSADELHLFAVQYAFIDERLHEAGQAMLKFMLEFLKRYGRVSLGLTEEEELDDNNFPVTTTLYGKHDTPRIKLTDVYLTNGQYLHADGIDAETGEKRSGFYIYSEQYADIFQFIGYASQMN
ncbi:hypothetical protein DW785_03790 [Bacteroides xylanisolvens]|jgi:hypothetical protein|uniref:Uncharacterized protein n=3 Tax=Bacteroidales TaxID=171549 RepID=A0A414HG79_BACT4|nr:hypothetical protein [Bacteroides fragilis]RGJ00035.1 hypothetical protein DXD78_14985 [Bacteroides sp. D20]RGJ37335.1 hypothetical protein DXD65_01985 [Bacteroides sp. 4_1_36]RHD69615.1 hypothetical protein DW785_03790 [Bacteroides xylanisolvens]RHD82785.1 hypothetical protein DW783_05240 [Phocaeicola vulgatus]RHD83958.1 hypothetical protein DW780_19915 [Bacteroides thetaiotaomicron]RJU56547.1 hypothetical protein DW777_05860 [Bacteroides sp. AM30-16]DAV56416.1 MAG TPA: hypothetical prot